MALPSRDWEKDIYAEGRQINVWPYTEVVSAFTHYRKEWTAPRQPRVLEVGCGTGNNLRALKDMGFAVAGIEISATGAEIARSFVGEDAEIRTGSMADLPWGDASFDFVLDRGGVTHVPADQIPQVASEIERVLVPGGGLHAETLFGVGHPDKGFGSRQPSGSYDFFEEGFFVRVGLTSFFGEAELRKIFSSFHPLDVRRTVVELNQRIESEVFSLVGVKSA